MSATPRSLRLEAFPRAGHQSQTPGTTAVTRIPAPTATSVQVVTSGLDRAGRVILVLGRPVVRAGDPDLVARLAVLRCVPVEVDAEDIRSRSAHRVGHECPFAVLEA